jgi:hypothetical protein
MGATKKRRHGKGRKRQAAAKSSLTRAIVTGWGVDNSITVCLLTIALLVGYLVSILEVVLGHDQRALILTAPIAPFVALILRLAHRGPSGSG